MPRGDPAYAALERELTRLLRLGRASGRAFAREVHPDLDWATYMIVNRIAETAPARASDLVDHFRVDKAVVSRQLAYLEQLELIERTADPTDRRAMAVRLTSEGKSRLQAVMRARNDRFRELIGEWPQEDVDDLARLLAKLNELPLLKGEDRVTRSRA